MKNISTLIFTCISMSGIAQSPISFPEALTGTNFSLAIHSDSVQFLPGLKTFTNAYNGYSYLGPTLILNKGDFISIHVENQLSDTSTAHWHGLHVPAADDGGPHTPILPGQTWSPDFVVLNNASTYWYHPHLHMKTGMQAMRGAAGFIIVRDPEESALNMPRRYGEDDFPLVIQSQEFDINNQILWRGMHDSIIIVNGTINPALDVPAQVIRLRLLNAAQERNFNFGFTDNRHFFVIGNDGGLLEQPVDVTRIRLSPGERAEILMDLTGMNGQNLYLMSYASEFPSGVQGGTPMPGMDTAMYSPINGIDFNILKMNVVNPIDNPVTTIPGSLVSISPWPEVSADTTRVINITADDMMSMDGPFYFNEQLFDMERIDQQIPLNNIEIWSISNQTMVAHPFHIHDVQFFVLDRDGINVAAEESGYKDVVMIGPNETVRFITKFEDFADTTMPYMYHCHILMHEDDGMMGQFIVVPGPFTGLPDIKIIQDNLRIYPNPVNDQLRIEFQDGSNPKSYTYRIVNTLGTTIERSTNFDQTIINVSKLSTGIYMLLIEFEDKIYSGKMIKN
jgi:blue copper oxidase